MVWAQPVPGQQPHPGFASRAKPAAALGKVMRCGMRVAAAPAWVLGRGTHSGQGFLDVLSGSRNVPEDHACAVLLQTVQKEPVFSFIKNFYNFQKKIGTLCPSCGERGSDVQDGSSAGSKMREVEPCRGLGPQACVRCAPSGLQTAGACCLVLRGADPAPQEQPDPPQTPPPAPGAEPPSAPSTALTWREEPVTGPFICS